MSSSKSPRPDLDILLLHTRWYSDLQEATWNTKSKVQTFFLDDFRNPLKTLKTSATCITRGKGKGTIHLEWMGSEQKGFLGRLESLGHPDALEKRV